MANFLAIYDADSKRRRVFLEKCKEEIAIFDDLKCDETSLGNFTVIWAATKRAPVSTYKDDKSTSVLIGDAIEPGEKIRLTAKELSEKWSNASQAQQNFYDGYYLAINFSLKNGFIAGGDILGLFPIYYFTDGTVTLIGSSPELFRHHPNFTPELCIEGLTGLMMTMHSIEGLTLWKNVYRLNAGHILTGEPNDMVKEVEQYRIPLSQKYYDIPFSQQIELIHEKFGAAVSRHIPSGQSYSLLFSGGLDSRMLAGYLNKKDSSIKAITFGKSSDVEMKMAKKAIKALNFEHHCVDQSYHDYSRYAQLTATWEHGLHGFNGISWWGNHNIEILCNATRVISGIHHDGIFSGSYKNTIRKEDTSDDVFNKIFSKVNTWGIAVEDIKELYLKESHKNTVDATIQKLKDRFLSYSESNAKRAWCFELYHRGRFHHGGAIWKMSFGAWPVIPIIDSAVLEIFGGLPSSSTSNRRAQRELVITYFPELARIHFDNNTNKPKPLLPTWQFQLWQKIIEPKLISRIAGAVKRIMRGGDWYKNLYYHRIYNIDNDGWKIVRRKAEQGRKLTAKILDKQALDRVLPASQVDIDKRLWDVAGIKTLLGFLIWLKIHNKK